MGDHIFISYAQRDRAYVRDLAGWMREAGLSPWWFEEDESHTGGMFAEMLMSAIGDARAVVVLLSRHSAASRAVAQEVIFAGERRKPIITLLREECAGPVRFLLSPDNWIDLRQIANPAPRIAAALAGDPPPPPVAYLAAAAGYEALVTPQFIALDAPHYQHPGAEAAPDERTLCTIGTLPSNSMVVSPRGGLVSRSHARICLQTEPDGEASFVLYSSGRNGTWVNGRRIEAAHRLLHADEIGLVGDFLVLQFLRHGETATVSRLIDMC